ncbi:hypothetical protein ACJ72_05509 [Emergomyces africanus]|uniref:Uncharacterized protein n=1 Tax=Emergomyces africanus TaxID=1955775 RepID=A0A1B7NTR3_9EURO|nr:hypothetical protein ACJ72_05509 [Emergomyces africanus]
MADFIRKLIFPSPDRPPAAAQPGLSAQPTPTTSSEPPIANNTEAPISPPPYSPSPTDVGLVRAFLKSTQPALPTEIADIILNFANYSVKDVAAFNPDRNFSITSRGPGVYGLILKGPQIRELKQDGLELRDLKLEAVKFEIVSHDQGWGGEPGTQGSYRNSFSWFEVTILRRVSHSEFGVEPPPNIDGELTLADYSQTYRRFGWDFVTDDNENTVIWPIQSNRVARRESQTHEIVWMFEDGDGEGQHAESEEDTGSGSGEGFVRALQPGDVICLWARAMYPGWANIVEKAVIEVAYSD